MKVSNILDSYVTVLEPDECALIVIYVHMIGGAEYRDDRGDSHPVHPVKHRITDILYLASTEDAYELLLLQKSARRFTPAGIA